jgi:hypothetical protein
MVHPINAPRWKRPDKYQQSFFTAASNLLLKLLACWFLVTAQFTAAPRFLIGL